jgi:hypothetical protein
MTTTTKPLRTKRRSFKDVSTEAYGKGHADGYADAVQLHAQVQERLLAENKWLQECLDKSIWSRLTGLFKGGRDAF